MFSRLAALLPDDTILLRATACQYVTWTPSSSPPVAPFSFMANRGASGIDGVVSSALGVAAVSQKRVVLVLGDISLYHDMNGLLAARAHGLNATIIVLNNKRRRHILLPATGRLPGRLRTLLRHASRADLRRCRRNVRA